MVAVMAAAGDDPGNSFAAKEVFFSLGNDAGKDYLGALQTSDIPQPVISYRKRTFETRSSMTMRKVLLSLTSLTAIR